MNAASWESSSEGLDFSREEDYFLVEITNDSRIIPAKPSDTCGSTKQINFSQFAPLPFYNINDNARWKLIETALNNIIIARNLAAADVIVCYACYRTFLLKFSFYRIIFARTLEMISSLQHLNLCWKRESLMEIHTYRC